MGFARSRSLRRRRATGGGAVRSRHRRRADPVCHRPDADRLTGAVVGDYVAIQTDQVMRNLTRVTELCGGGLADVVSVRAFLLDWNDYGAFNAAYAAWFPDRLPSARVSASPVWRWARRRDRLGCLARRRMAGAMTGVRRVIPLVVGWERLPKSYSVHGDASGAVLGRAGARGAAGHRRRLDAARRRDQHRAGTRPSAVTSACTGRNHAIVPILPDVDDEPLQHALAAPGSRSATSRGSSLSHLRNDHRRRAAPVRSGRFRSGCSARARVRPRRSPVSRAPRNVPDRLRSDPEIDSAAARRRRRAPGISAVLTPGHTPGHQSA